MRASELRTLTVNELESKLRALKIELAKERAVIASGTRPEKPTKIRNTRKDIARILTILSLKEKAGELPKETEVAKIIKKEEIEKVEHHTKMHKKVKAKKEKTAKAKKDVKKDKKTVKKKTGVKK